MAQAPSIKLDYRTPRVAPLTAPPRPDPALNWMALAGMAAALCLEIAALVTALMWPNLKARLCLFGVVGLAHVAFVWLCCLLARAKRYHPAWGLLGIPLIGGLAIPLLPTDEDEDRLLVGAHKAPYFVGWRHVVSVFVAYAFVLGAFWNSFESGWVLDNLYIIKYDPRTQATQWESGFNAIAQPGVIEYFRQDYWWPKGISGLYRPLTSITYWLNWTVLGGGTDTTGMHVVNLVLHWLNASLVYALAYVLTRRWAIALVAGLIFATHPISVESVTNIIGRADQFAALAVLGGVLVWRWAGTLPRWWTIAGFVGVMLITGFGVFAKESAVAIGLVILVYDLVYRWHPALAKWFGVVVGLALIPAVSGGVFAIQHPWWERMGFMPRVVTAAMLALAGAGVHAWLTTTAPDRRLRAMLAALGFAVLAGAFVPAAGAALFAIVVLYELFAGPWLRDRFPEFDRIKLPAAIYTAGFVACVFLPLAVGALLWFKAGADAKQGVMGVINVTGASWPADTSAMLVLSWPERVTRAALFVLAGLFAWLFFTVRNRLARAVMLFALAVVPLVCGLIMWKDVRLTAIGSAVLGAAAIALGVVAILREDEAPAAAEGRPWLAIPVVLVAALCASVYIFYAGFVLSFVVGWIELVRRQFLPDALRASALWKELVRRYVVGYYLLLPPMIAMFFVRYYIFNIVSTPPETPFLDNPLRGGPFDPLPFWQSRMTAIKVMGKLIYLLVWPVHLSSDYSWDQIPFFLDSRGPFVWENVKAVVALLVVAGAVALAVWSYTRNKALSFFILFFFAAILPTSNLPVLIGSIMAERFMYLPLIGFAAAVAIGLVLAYDALSRWMDAGDARAFPRWARATSGALAVAVVVVLFSYRSYRRNFDWRSDITLWESAMDVSPRSFRCYQSLAFAYFEKDQKGLIDKMIATAEQARPIVDPLPHDRNSSRLYLHLGMYYNLKGDTLCKPDGRGNALVTPEAREYYEKAAAVLERGSAVDRTFNAVNRRKQIERGDRPDRIYDSGLTPVYMTMGMSYMRLGRYREALNAFQYQRQLEPEGAEAYVRIAGAHVEQQNYDDAAVALIQAILLDQNRRDAWNMLGWIYSLGGDKTAGALQNTPGGPRLVIDNPVVRQHFIGAYRSFIRVFRWANRPHLAETARQAAIYRYNMPPSLFDSLMVEEIPEMTPQGPVYPDAKTADLGQATTRHTR